MKILAQEVRREERAVREYEIDGVPDLVEYERHRHGAGPVGVIMRPERVQVVWINGVFRVARVEGKRLKNNGEPGRVEGSRTYSARWFEEPGPNDVPQWLYTLVAAATEPTMLEYQTQEDQKARAKRGRD